MAAAAAVASVLGLLLHYSGAGGPAPLGVGVGGRWLLVRACFPLNQAICLLTNEARLVSRLLKSGWAASPTCSAGCQAFDRPAACAAARGMMGAAIRCGSSALGVVSAADGNYVVRMRPDLVQAMRRQSGML